MFGIWMRPSMASVPPDGALKFVRWVSMRAEVQALPSRSGVMRRLPLPSRPRLRVWLV
jgi:hypothetical protein